MEIISVNRDNIQNEHICCAISDKKGDPCVTAKKEWMIGRFDDGLVFQKLDARGKVFIEYIPAENAWMPVEAPEYMMINCFWVSGRYKGQGYANQLLQVCMDDAKRLNKKGIAALSSAKKKPFLSDPKYLKYKGFKTADTAPPYYELLYLPFDKDAEKPRIKESAKTGRIAEQGVVIYFTNQCPYAEKYALLAGEIAVARGVAFRPVKIMTKQQAQSAPMPFTTYGLFYNGAYITNEIYSEKKFAAFLDEKGA